MAKRGKNDFNVDFLYKTMLERDPSKRRVKPVAEHLLQVDFAGLEDSSSDSDFQVDFEDDESNEESVDDDAGSEVGNDNDDDDDDDDGDNNDNNSVDSGNFDGGKANRNKNNTTLNNTDHVDDTDGAKVSTKVTASHLLVCCVCLKDDNTEDDEIIVCDGCAASVHEGCYGVSDAESVDSSQSSASTEPWFCDACRAGVKPHCELCPNSGGIYKETDVGRWVHLVCALYVHGVAFIKPDLLREVTLFEMPYTKWGAKRCSLCDDERFSWTGVCTSCDAGMCRTYFHATCAHRYGLLSEADDENISDPLFAYCKQHVDKAMSRSKRRNWMAFQAFVKEKLEEWKNSDSPEQVQIKKKLQQHVKEYHESKAKRPSPWVLQERVPRMVETCPSALARLLRKTELMGASALPDVVSAAEVRKKWHVPPALSAEFACYYHDRSERIASMRKKGSELVTEKKKLDNEDRILQSKQSQLKSELDILRKTYKQLMASVQQFYKYFSDITGKKIELPEFLRKKQLVVATDVNDGNKHSAPVSGQCGICQLSENQHLFVQCDVCRVHYHLGCLDPPLTRMPKKTRQQGWQCSRCVVASNSDNEAVSELGEYRKLRENIKQPIKYLPVLKKRKRSGHDRARTIKRAAQTLNQRACGRQQNETDSPGKSAPTTLSSSNQRASNRRKSESSSPGRAHGRQHGETGSPGRARGRQQSETSSPGRAHGRQQGETGSPGRAHGRQQGETSSPGRAHGRQQDETGSSGKVHGRQQDETDSPGKAHGRQLSGTDSPGKLSSTAMVSPNQSQEQIRMKRKRSDSRRKKESEGLRHDSLVEHFSDCKITINLSKLRQSNEVQQADQNLKVEQADTFDDSYQADSMKEHQALPNKDKSLLLKIEGKCVLCSEAAGPRNSVRCDTCRRWYHSYCLSPPMKLPRMKGYIWHCVDCNVSSLDSSSNDVD